MLGFFKHFFQFQFLLIVVAILIGIYCPQFFDKFSNFIKIDKSLPEILESNPSEQNNNEEVLFTKENLEYYNGENGKPIYLSLLGSVYDVTKGVKHYGPGCSYNFFVGRDASLSFITGEFEEFDEEKSSDVNSLEPNDLLGLDKWQKFYNKDYTLKGKLIGRFYDFSGFPTPYYHKYIALLQQAQQLESDDEKLKEIYPDCNIEWSAKTGTRVWCTSLSGGKNRQWIGHPRKLFQIGSDSFRCACVEESKLDTTEVMLKPYEECLPKAFECFYEVD